MCSPVIFTAMGASAGTASTLAAVSQIGLIAGGTMMSICLLYTSPSPRD